MTRLMIAALFVLVAGASVCAESGLQSSVALSRTTFLSTDAAKATLSVINGGYGEATLDPRSITIATYVSGAWKEAPYCQRDCWRIRTIAIASGARKDLQIDLPSCEVLSDPCDENVRVRYAIQIGGQSRTYYVRLPQYWFVPDPKATYRDVPDGLPVFIALGSAKATVVPTAVTIGVTAAPSPNFSASSRPPPHFEEEVVALLRSSGLEIAGTGMGVDNPSWYLPDAGSGNAEGRWRVPNNPPASAWRWLFQVNNGSAQLDKINGAMEAIRRQMGDRVSTVNARYDVDFDDGNEIWRAAQDDAHPRAAHLAEITNSGDPGSGTMIASSYTVENARTTRYDPHIERVYPQLAPLSALDVSLRVQMRYVGALAPDVRIAPPVAEQAAQAYRSVWALPTFAPAVVTAADRPELYVTGGSSQPVAVRSGVDPEAAALLNARVQTRELARLLGVHIVDESLFAIGARLDSERAIGLATAFSGDATAPAVERGPTMRVFQSRHPNGVVKVPIAIARPEKTIAEQTTVQEAPVSNVLLFEIEVQSNARAADVDAHAIADTIRKSPGIVATSETESNGGATVRYAILLPQSRRRMLAAIDEAVRRGYAAFEPTLEYSLGPYIGDCRALRERLLRETLNRNVLAARTEAASAKVRLRKLLLVAVAPTDEGSACGPLERDPRTLEYDSLQSIPDALTPAPLDVSSLMVFRTSP